MITEQELKDAGYRKHAGNGHQPYSDFFYQKRFTDEHGIKYHVELNHYAAITWPNGQPMSESWMAELHNNEPHMTFQIHRPDSIADVEDRAEKFWRSMACDYYERYENHRA